jgi:CRISPR system Cascade subunit CasE
MFMFDLSLDSAKLMRFAHMQGIPLGSDEDFGYATHAWLAASLGNLAPRPYRLFERQDGLHLLGYGVHDTKSIREHAQLFAEPIAAEVCNWPSVAGKALPGKWVEGRRLGFEVRVCPVSRGERERDVFLASLERSEAHKSTPPSRAEVYLEWLIQRMSAASEPKGHYIDTEGAAHAPAVELLTGQVSLVGFRRVRVLRRSEKRGKSKKGGIERPDAIFSGDLVVRDPEKFANLLKKGIGRHKAFGFGMLLLRPPGR